jgi:hypothetical protein
MSQDDSTAPESAGTPGVAAPRSPSTWVLAGLALVLVIGLVGFFALRGDGNEPQAPTASPRLSP